MKQLKFIIPFLSIFLAMGTCLADSTSSQMAKCVSGTTRNFLSCTSACNEKRNDEVLLCKSDNKTSARDCIKGCFSIRNTCVKTIQAALNACIAQSKGVLDTALAACTESGVVLRLACRAAARLEKLTADIECASQFRRDKKAQGELKACFSESTTCTNSCKKTSTPTPTPAS